MTIKERRTKLTTKDQHERQKLLWEWIKHGMSLSNFRELAPMCFSMKPVWPDNVVEAARIYRKILKKRDEDETNWGAAGMTYTLDQLSDAERNLDRALGE